MNDYVHNGRAMKHGSASRRPCANRSLCNVLNGKIVRPGCAIAQKNGKLRGRERRAKKQAHPVVFFDGAPASFSSNPSCSLIVKNGARSSGAPHKSIPTTMPSLAQSQVQGSMVGAFPILSSRALASLRCSLLARFLWESKVREENLVSNVVCALVAKPACRLASGQHVSSFDVCDSDTITHRTSHLCHAW